MKIYGENGKIHGDGYQTNYDQSNWLMFNCYNKDESCNLHSKYQVGDVIKAGTVIGMEEDDFGEIRVYMDKYTMPETTGEKVEVSYNVYTPANLLSSNWNIAGHSSGNKNFWAIPKHYEIADIIWAVYAGDGKFYMPKPGETLGGHNHNASQDKGGFSVFFYPGFATINGEQPLSPNVDEIFTVNTAYQFRALLAQNLEPFLPYLTDDESEPVISRRVKEIAPYTDSELSSMLVLPVEITAQSVVTGIFDLNEGKVSTAVKAVRVYNVNGAQLREAQSGVNIIVTEYMDGTTTTTKVVK